MRVISLSAQSSGRRTRAMPLRTISRAALNMATPDMSHVTAADFDEVYEPYEDSFLLMDALEAERDALLALGFVLLFEFQLKSAPIRGINGCIVRK